MIKVFLHIVTWGKKKNYDYIFFQKQFIRTTILLSLIIHSKINLFQVPFEYFTVKLVFAQTEKKKADSPINHRLKNFLLSTKDRDEWTQMMLAILNSVPAVESVLSQGIRVNIRGTDRFHGVTPLMFASKRRPSK